MQGNGQLYSVWLGLTIEESMTFKTDRCSCLLIQWNIVCFQLCPRFPNEGELPRGGGGGVDDYYRELS